jgi:ElaA protein
MCRFVVCFPADVKIAAQAYLTAFYGAFGFVKVSEKYLEDGIAHIDMELSASKLSIDSTC